MLGYAGLSAEALERAAARLGECLEPLDGGARRR
jgi:hypothetical protein